MFGILTQEIQDKIWKKVDENPDFADGLANSFGNALDFIDTKTRETLLKKAEENSDFLYSLTKSVGESFEYLDDKVKKDLWQMATKEESIAKVLGAGIGYKFMEFNNTLQNEVLMNLKDYEESSSIHTYFAIGLAKALTMAEGDNRREMWNRTEDDIYFTETLGQGLGMFVDAWIEKFEDEVWSVAEKNDIFASNLGCGAGSVFTGFDKTIQQYLNDKAKVYSKFSEGMNECKTVE
jgi:hypothetical protein